jgi:hypothetical protein
MSECSVYENCVIIESGIILLGQEARNALFKSARLLNVFYPVVRNYLKSDFVDLDSTSKYYNGN